MTTCFDLLQKEMEDDPSDLENLKEPLQPEGQVFAGLGEKRFFFKKRQRLKQNVRNRGMLLKCALESLRAALTLALD